MSLKYYTSPIEVYNKVVDVWENTVVNKNKIYEMCFDAEINHIKDGDLMSKFKEFPLDVDSTTGLAVMPCNVIRVIEVYNEKGVDIPYTITGGNHVKVPGVNKEVFMHYYGVTADEDGVPVIHQGHVNALVTFCLMRLVEKQVLKQKMPMGFLQKYELQFSNQVISVRQSAQYKDRKFYDNVNIIRFNMIKKVGRQRLMKTMFE